MNSIKIEYDELYKQVRKIFNEKYLEDGYCNDSFDCGFIEGVNWMIYKINNKIKDNKIDIPVEKNNSSYFY